jgi:hypothetical protein
MKSGIDLSKHITITSHGEIDQICAPIKKLGINYFSYVKSFIDGSHIRLSNNPHWTNHYYQNKYYNVVLNQIPKINGHILWSCIDKYPLFQDASEIYDVDNGIVIVELNDSTVERYFYGSTRNNYKINEFYCFNINLLYRFNLYFKEKARKIINNAANTKIIVPKDPVNSLQNNPSMTKKSMINQFIEETKIKKIPVEINGEILYLSKRQAQLIYFMSKGFTSKQIANKMTTTFKTIDFYKQNIKAKSKRHSCNSNLSFDIDENYLNESILFDTL